MKKGFTLVELMIVVLIIGIISAAAVPSMQKSMELNRATEAIGTMMQIANAQKTCRVNNITQQDTSCPRHTFSASSAGQACSSNPNLVACGYFPNMDWVKSFYNFGTADSSGCFSRNGAGMEACTANKNSSGSPSYYTLEGECNTLRGKDNCPKINTNSGSGGYTGGYSGS